MHMYRIFSSLLILISAFSFTACNNTKVTAPADQQQNTAAPALAPKNQLMDSLFQPHLGQVAPESYWKNKNCPRGVPDQTLSNTNPNLSDIQFSLNKDGGLETAKLVNGDSLSVYNTGCDYIALTYTLKSFSSQAATGDMKYWLGRASDLLLALQDSKVPFGYQDVSGTLHGLAQGSGAQLGKEIPLPDEGNSKSRCSITILEAGKLASGKGGYVKMKIFLGPL